jgi:hypothetical protein
VPLSQLLERVKQDDQYLKVVLLASRSTKPSDGALAMEERYYRIEDLRKLNQ